MSKAKTAVRARANDRQVGGTHYKDQAIEPWDYVLANGLGYLEGNIVKYVTRHRAKHGVQDLEKAQHYLEKLIEHERATAPAIKRRKRRG